MAKHEIVNLKEWYRDFMIKKKIGRYDYHIGFCIIIGSTLIAGGILWILY